MIAGSLAKRYARALLDVAAETQAAEGVLRELAGVATLIDEQRELRLFLLNPSVRRRDAVQVLDEIAGRLQVSPLARTFLRVLLEAGRIAALRDILRAYGEILDERIGRVRAAVTAATPLSGEQQANLASELGRLTGKQVVLEVAEDPAILGGVVARIGSLVYDGSLKTRLAQLRRELTATD